MAQSSLRDRLTQEDAATIEDTDFTGAMLGDLNLQSKTFLRCNFSNCNFRSAELTDCVFQNCRLTSADMSYVRFDNVAFEASCEAVGITLIDTMAHDLRIHDSKFSGANLQGMTASELSLDQSIFAHANLAGLSLRGQSITKLTAPGAIWDNCDLRETRWIDCVLVDGSYAGAKMRGANVSLSDIGRPSAADILGPMKGAKISLGQAQNFVGALGYAVV
jgi:fluoroquinolone resistance protein